MSFTFSCLSLYVAEKQRAMCGQLERFSQKIEQRDNRCSVSIQWFGFVVAIVFSSWGLKDSRKHSFIFPFLVKKQATFPHHIYILCFYYYFKLLLLLFACTFLFFGSNLFLTQQDFLSSHHDAINFFLSSLISALFFFFSGHLILFLKFIPFCEVLILFTLFMSFVSSWLWVMV